MIILRPIAETDLEDLEKFSQIPGLYNLSGDQDQLKERIHKSIQSFKSKNQISTESKYIFVVEDTDLKKVLGTSMIASQHGSEESPHFYFEVGSEKKFSDSMNTGFIHGTLKLKYETNGPSEIGGLVLDAEVRNRDDRIGRQISFVRFLFLGMFPERFKKKIIAELLPPLNKKGQSPLWEAIGRRFTNMDYWEADSLSQKNKEFFLSLFPSGKIYTTFLPAEARNAIGKVGKETEPVMHMLTKIGFTYKANVDPFDGGPHLWAEVDKILPLKKLASYTYDGMGGQETESGLLCKKNINAIDFKAVAVKASIFGKKIQVCSPLSNDVETALGIKPGDETVFMPFY